MFFSVLSILFENIFIQGDTMYPDEDVLRYFILHHYTPKIWLYRKHIELRGGEQDVIVFQSTYKDLQTEYFSDIKAPTQLELDFFRLQVGFDWPFGNVSNPNKETL